MKNKLIEKALKIEDKRKQYKDTGTREELELVLAWVRGELTYSQVNSVIPDDRQVGVYALHILRWAYLSGNLVLKEEKQK